MSKSSEQIKQDLAALQTIVRSVAIELEDNYEKYLQKLSESVPKQLILVSYQICTQEYPEYFLDLSLDRRQNLQQNFRQLGKELGEKLVSNLGKSDENTSLAAKTAPRDWLDWHKEIQTRIKQDLEEVSKQANQLLEAAEILPDRLPEKVMEIALAAENTDSPISGYPNMLNMIIEAENNTDSEAADITKITAIRLRLSEIEFADPAISARANQIRNILAKIDKIEQQYQQKERELLTAEAEAAWRSSWFED